VCREAGDEAGEGSAECGLGEVQAAVGQQQAALLHHQQHLAIATRTGDKAAQIKWDPTPFLLPSLPAGPDYNRFAGPAATSAPPSRP
jgi:hypothetical protein